MLAYKPSQVSSGQVSSGQVRSKTERISAVRDWTLTVLLTLYYIKISNIVKKAIITHKQVRSGQVRSKNIVWKYLFSSQIFPTRRRESTL